MEERLKEILAVAMQYHVTDIHFDISRQGNERISISMRVNGKMKQLKPNPDDMKLFRYLMYRANLDVSETMRPQTGAFYELSGETLLSLRFAIVSSYHMMSGVLRILNNHSDLTIEQLSFDDTAVKWMKQITEYRTGLFLFSGPTGSGKTTSLYTILNQTRGKKIFTLEDPVEVVNEKYVQLQINEKQNLSYANGIKQLMRHDPDILMIGEIRDETAAVMACRTALTGHLVVSSIHASSCVSAIHRMMDLNVPEYMLKDVLRGIANQRLYERDDHTRTGVYEIMDQKQLEIYFEKGAPDESFISLSEKTAEAVRNRWINAEENVPL